MKEIIYPSLSLFSYEITYSLGEENAEVNTNLNHVLANLTKEINRLKPDNGLKWDKIKEKSSSVDYYRILPKNDPDLNIKEYQFNFKEKKKLDENRDLELKGYYYPVIFSDTYSLLLDIQNSKQEESLPIKCLPILKHQLMEKRGKTSDNFIGETSIIYGILPSCDISNYQEIAKESYQYWLTNEQQNSEKKEPSIEKYWQNNLKSESEFFNGFVFELWQKEDKLEIEKHHVIIILYKSYDDLKKAAQLNPSWLRLFCYRHKVIKAYEQSQTLKKELKEYFAKIFDMISKVRSQSNKTELTGLGEILQEAQSLIEEYSLKFSTFDYQRRAIAINLENYKERLTTMQEQANPGDLEELEKFGNYATEKYLEQIKWDAKNLSPGNTLLHGLIDSISTVRSIIEIKRAESDRRFQQNVGLWGIILAICSIVASLSAQFPTAILPIISFLSAMLKNWGIDLENLGIDDNWLSVVLSLIIVLFVIVICLGIGCLCSKNRKLL